MLILLRKPWNSPPNGESPYLTHSLCKSTLNLGIQHLSFLGDISLLLLILHTCSGVKQAQVFVGRDTLVADAYPMNSGKQFVNTLEGNIRRRGAMDNILPRLRYPIRSWTFSGQITFQIDILSPTTRTKSLLNGGTGLSNPGPIDNILGLENTNAPPFTRF